jgi:hypothetical protein
VLGVAAHETARAGLHTDLDQLVREGARRMLATRDAIGVDAVGMDHPLGHTASSGIRDRSSGDSGADPLRTMTRPSSTHRLPTASACP